MSSRMIRFVASIALLQLIHGCAAPGSVPVAGDPQDVPDVEVAAPEQKALPRALPRITPQTTRRSTNPAAQRLLATADDLQRQGALSQAASVTERAIRIDPRESQAYYRLASIRRQQGEFAQALELAKKALHWQPGSSMLKEQLWMLVADCYESLGDSAAAERARQHNW